jgi:aspartate kinase
VHLIQNSAISFSVCLDDKFNNFQTLIKQLKKKYDVSYNENVSLYTIRHYTTEAQEMVEKNKTVLIKQNSRGTMQIVTKE